MSGRYPYDVRRDPPAPVLAVRLGPPGQAPSTLLGALVDTGADLSAVPDPVAQGLGLPAVGLVSVRGVGGAAQRAVVYAAELEAGGVRLLVEVVGVGADALLGRDLLNRWIVTLRGPQRLMEVSFDARARRR